MAFRFRREGDFVKHRKRLSNSGMQPWVNDFKHRVVAWHYNFYMKDQARRAIGHSQHSAESAQRHYDGAVGGSMQTCKGLKETAGLDGSPNGFSTAYTKYFNFQTCIPNVTPYRKISNPFCAVTANSTGWTAVREKRIGETQPMQGHAIAGTDDSVPIFPKFRP